MLKVGLTGGIGSGKTTVARIFAILGIPVFDADKAGRTVLNADAGLVRSVQEKFGDALYVNGVLDRAALAKLVFNDPEALKALNAMVHPAVRNAFKEWASEQTTPVVMMEAAILVETGGYAAMDRLVVVTAPEPLRVQRVMRRDKVDEGAVRARLKNQATDAQRGEKAHYTIVNDEQRLVIPQVLAVATALNELSGSWTAR